MILLACTLIAVIDGDTLKADCNNAACWRYCMRVEHTIRIANIDAPEYTTCPTEAEASKDALHALLMNSVSGAAFNAEMLYNDRHGRSVSVLISDGLPEGDDDISATARVSIGDEMVRLGFAKSWKHSEDGKLLEPKPRGC